MTGILRLPCPHMHANFLLQQMLSAVAPILQQDPFGEDDWDPSTKFTSEIDMEVGQLYQMSTQCVIDV